MHSVISHISGIVGHIIFLYTNKLLQTADKHFIEWLSQGATVQAVSSSQADFCDLNLWVKHYACVFNMYAYVHMWRYMSVSAGQSLVYHGPRQLVVNAIKRLFRIWWRALDFRWSCMRMRDFVSTKCCSCDLCGRNALQFPDAVSLYQTNLILGVGV